MPSTYRVLVITLFLTAAASADWPCYQGPDRSGVVDATTWSSEGAVEPLWTLEAGQGYSCPSIVDGRLVTMGYDGAAERDVIFCVDAVTGASIWRHDYEATDAPQYHDGGTLTTPAIHDGIVYTFNRHGVLHALGLDDGSVRWTRDYQSELGLESVFHGYCASPIVLDDRIVLIFGGVAAAVARDGGDVMWRTDDVGDGAYANPALVHVNGRDAVAAMLGQTCYVLDLEDGSALYEIPWPLQGNAVHVQTPLVLGDRLFLSTAYNKGCALIHLGDDVAGETLWANKRLRNKVTGTFLHGEHIYGFDESMLKCIDLEGNEAWRVRGLGMGSLAIAGDRLIILSSKGELVIAEASPDSYVELSRRPVLEGGVYWTMPVLVDGLLYVRNSEGTMHCLDHRIDAAGRAAPEPDRQASAPDAASLYAAHATRVGGDRLRDHVGLRLTGELEILARGMAPTPATFVLSAPNSWRLGVDAGWITESYDGEIGWTDEPRGAWLLEGEDLAEARRIFEFRELFAPAAPADAVIAGEPVFFGDASCWAVASASKRVVHYFDVESGHLVGHDGEGLSSLVFAGELQFDGVLLPSRITRFRRESGQEETFVLGKAEWLDDASDAYPKPDAIMRLLLAPEELEVKNDALRQRFGDILGRYRADPEWFADEVIEIVIDTAALCARMDGNSDPLDVSSGGDGPFEIHRSGGWTVEFERDDAGTVTGIRMRGEAGEPVDIFLPRIGESSP